MEEIREAINNIKAQLSDLPGLKEKLDSVQSTVYEMSESMKQTLDSISSKMDSIEQKCDRTLNLVENLAKENSYLKTKIRTLEEKLITAEAYFRHDNLLIDVIVYSECEDLVQKVRDVMKFNMKVDDVDQIKFIRVHRLRSAKTPQTTIVNFHYFPDKRSVWSKRANLKCSNIWIEIPLDDESIKTLHIPFYEQIKS